MNVVLIPAYEPDNELVRLVSELERHKLKIVVVDDGSGPKYADIFESIKSSVDLVTLPHNCGKGAALKAGMRYIKQNLTDCSAFITCDADGQHRAQDVLRVAALLDKGENSCLP